MSAIKYDSGKPRLDLVSRDALEELGKVLGFGADKYGANNWSKGMDWSRCYGAALRHIMASLDREDSDPESGLDHLAHAMANLMFLLEYKKKAVGNDDRK